MISYFPSKLLGKPLVRGVRIHEQSFPCFLEIVVLGPSILLSEMRSAEDSLDLARRSCLALVIVQLGASVADVISEVSFSDEFLDLILKHNALLGGVTDIFVVPTIFVLISF